MHVARCLRITRSGTSGSATESANLVAQIVKMKTVAKWRDNIIQSDKKSSRCLEDEQKSDVIKLFFINWGNNDRWTVYIRIASGI